MRRVLALMVAAAALAAGGAEEPRASAAPAATFATVGRQALDTLLHVYYAGNGLWNQCDLPNCVPANSDWGVDSLTYALYLRWSTAHDASIPPVMAALTGTATGYQGACQLGACDSWSDVPQWDTIADVREYQVTHDVTALAKARAAFLYAESSNAFALGACPDIRYQQPNGRDNQLKTLETDGNAIKAAVLLYEATGDNAYLTSAVRRYAAVRRWFLDPHVPLYSVYVFDDGTRCTQLPHRFFASVNGDMIWSGFELSALTGRNEYLAQALASAKAVASLQADPEGIFADLQAENDIEEPLVEAMYLLASDGHQAFARSWIVENARAALSARTHHGSFGRFFDGPPPRTTVTAWQTNGGIALELAAAALDPEGAVAPARTWGTAHRVATAAGTSGTIRFTGSAIALLGTLGESCCEPGHARVFVDGRETFDQTGVWQNKSSLGRPLPDTVLFAWGWPRPGEHTITFAPGVPNGKEGGPFLHVAAYLVRP